MIDIRGAEWYKEVFQRKPKELIGPGEDIHKDIKNGVGARKKGVVRV
jgi:hypothetical protein